MAAVSTAFARLRYTTATFGTHARAFSSVPLPDDPIESDEEFDLSSSPSYPSSPSSPSSSTTYAPTFRAADVVFTPTLHAANRHAYVKNTLIPQLRAQNNNSLGFGVFFSDHMLSASYDSRSGWSTPKIGRLGPLSLHPAAQVLHYGMSCFEGMKVYKHLGDDTGCTNLLFRPELNLARFVASARRLHLPSTFCPNELLSLMKSLVRADAGWVPDRRGEALYLRPVLYAVSDMLGVAPPESAALNVVMSPSGDYFSGKGGKEGNDGTEGLGGTGGVKSKAIRLFVEEGYARAWVGGAGNAKVGGNYAPTIYPQWLARQKYGVDQIVYTRDGNFEECGAMNIFFVFEADGGVLELATPGLEDGTILPGVTRASILEIARAWSEDRTNKRNETNIVVREGRVGVEEIAAMAEAGRLREVFACGTASVVQPVAGLVRRIGGYDEYGGDGDGGVVEMVPRDSSFGPGSVTRRIYDTLVDIQHGLSADPRFASWSVEI